MGKGGSSRVYRVLSQDSELFAIKRVALDKNDPDTMASYMNEISLLKRLNGNERIIRLIDSEVQNNNRGRQNFLYLVMECGEIDLAKLLQEQQKRPMNLVWIAYYWQQMLEAVHVIHEEKIVHSDLKPANFVLVRGQLKLIDFGIANAIANDTTNIQRDHQVGTVNYMSPEAIELPDGMRRLKLGRPSDVWSLGCILYQMVYGVTPFSHLAKPYQKMKAIPDPTYEIEFPAYTAPVERGISQPDGSVTPPRRLEHLKRRVGEDVVDCMKICLMRTPKDRATIPELLDQEWLSSVYRPKPTAKDLLKEDETIINPYFMRQLLEYGISLGATHPEGLPMERLVEEGRRLVAELKALEE
ncbi:kinase-like domain-containing protein [Vararia minispora EC-137]|uniref:Kinase-like domain-containing protein n=1 Tax=Vararia minispora EC-137 TaxID=1314806 RepID=A0ACB8QUH9_9AGAM|nr:kinase-like domain-containing protein [Vararia minispora EC-137]